MGHTSENLIDHDLQVKCCASVNFHHQTSPLTAGTKSNEHGRILLVPRLLAATRGDRCDACFPCSAASCVVSCDIIRRALKVGPEQSVGHSYIGMTGFFRR